MINLLADIEERLKEPFPLDEIGLLPKGKPNQDGKVMAMAYADPRAYEDRLNALVPGEWSTPAPTMIAVGNKLVCCVTVIIRGIPHTDVGEADPGENQGTEAWAQGFKRACSQFGLGRYLYDLDKEYVPYDTQYKKITLDKAGRQSVVKRMYQKAGITFSSPSPTPPEPPTTTKPKAPAPVETKKEKVVATTQAPTPALVPTSPSTPQPVPVPVDLAVLRQQANETLFTAAPYEALAILSWSGIEETNPEQWSAEMCRLITSNTEKWFDGEHHDQWIAKSITQKQYDEITKAWAEVFGGDAIKALKTSLFGETCPPVSKLTRGRADMLVEQLRNAEPTLVDGKIVPKRETVTLTAAAAA